ncbi:hypothetical protein C427_0707 [Paraglaciecola psychrophila 170]|uniref:Uncharacterized protein n=1 Tax=Paraglaciecola psychrophila 170 TaxID=1129794 RepID=K6ZL62_9ALTE|nr:hypothetical protein C427_0707 [Paraglaciecola psychrophila 170]GAC36706.1 hypothetical protein GPSY_1068 [Paraglaciecola psychrophila 170]
MLEFYIMKEINNAYLDFGITTLSLQHLLFKLYCKATKIGFIF